MDPIDTAESLEVDPGTGDTNESCPQSSESSTSNNKPIKMNKRVIILSAGPGSSGSAITDLQSTQDSMNKAIEEKDASNPEVHEHESYILVRKKNKSADYDPKISTTTVEETRIKLRELLENNIKLQETLERNNSDIQRKRKVLAACGEKPDKAHMTEQQTEDSSNKSKNGYSEPKIIIVTKESKASGDPDLKAEASVILKDRCAQQVKNIDRYGELTGWLEEKSNMPRQTPCPAFIFQSRGDCRNSPPLTNGQFSRSLKQYKDMLIMLSECHAEHNSHYVNVQECLQNSFLFIDNLEINTPSNEETVNYPLEDQQKLANCQRKMWVQIQYIINEMDEVMKAQNQFQKVLDKFDFLFIGSEVAGKENCKTGHQLQQYQYRIYMAELLEQANQRIQAQEQKLKKAEEFSRQQTLWQEKIKKQPWVNQPLDLQQEERRKFKMQLWDQKQDPAQRSSGWSLWLKQRDERLKQQQQQQWWP